MNTAAESKLMDHFTAFIRFVKYFRKPVDITY